MQLGQLIKVNDLRSVWKNERSDFSAWLAREENLRQLGDTIGIDIKLAEVESSVGVFSVDLLAAEEGTGRKIVIENQLEDTDHDHLGKIITYAAGKGADFVVWIVKRARDEHRAAVEWLNQRTDESVGFFLIEIELWKIGGSPLAPKFNIVERPNDWVKTTKNLSENRKTQLEFWQQFIDYAYNRPDFAAEFSRRKPEADSHFDIGHRGYGYTIVLSASTQKRRLGCLFCFHNKEEIFEKFEAREREIEEFLGAQVQWRGTRMFVYKDGDITAGLDLWQGYFHWLCDMALKFRDMAKKFDI